MKISGRRTLGEGKDDMMKKRYNVAVSRAKDQLWVVHSIDWRKQLTERDLRWKLLSYMNGVNTRTRSDQEIERDSDSVFENRVAKHLRSKGYEFTQQYPARRISDRHCRGVQWEEDRAGMRWRGIPLTPGRCHE